MKQLSIILCIFSCLIPHMFAQNKLHDRFSFSISSGAAIPVGTFGMKDISNAAIYYVPVNEPAQKYFIGIDKSKSGFAKVGYYYNAQFSYRITNHLFLFLRAGQTTNSVQTSVISEFVTQFNKEPEEFVEVDYKIGSVTPGLGYTMSLKQWDISLGLFGGRARSNFPLYKAIYLNSGTPPSIWAFEGETPNLFSFSKGGELSVNRQIKRISAGLEITYQNSNFKYDIKFRRIPGYDYGPIVHDKLIVSLLTVGLQLAYTFGK
ncbi:MAG: hypothetical protein GZ094_16380 [Mariniphaga sp.]|nr:hypothetical protein [Mariniphaga sp.]